MPCSFAWASATRLTASTSSTARTMPSAHSRLPKAAKTSTPPVMASRNMMAPNTRPRPALPVMFSPQDFLSSSTLRPIASIGPTFSAASTGTTNAAATVQPTPTTQTTNFTMIERRAHRACDLPDDADPLGDVAERLPDGSGDERVDEYPRQQGRCAPQAVGHAGV